MKMYSEEKTRLIINESRNCTDWWEQKFGLSEDEVISQVTPIELPTDEEASVIALNIAHTLKYKLTTEQEAYFIAGFQTYSKWLKEQIKNEVTIDEQINDGYNKYLKKINEVGYCNFVDMNRLDWYDLTRMGWVELIKQNEDFAKEYDLDNIREKLIEIAKNK